MKLSFQVFAEKSPSEQGFPWWQYLILYHTHSSPPWHSLPSIIMLCKLQNSGVICWCPPTPLELPRGHRQGCIPGITEVPLSGLCYDWQLHYCIALGIWVTLSHAHLGDWLGTNTFLNSLTLSVWCWSWAYGSESGYSKMKYKDRMLVWVGFVLFFVFSLGDGGVIRMKISVTDRECPMPSPGLCEEAKLQGGPTYLEEDDTTADIR